MSVYRALAASVVVAALVAGCGSLPPLEHVVLSPPQTQRAAAQPSNWQVQRVQMPAYLDNYDIQIRTGNYVLKHLKNAKWAERLPVATTQLLQQTINEKLERKRGRHYTVEVTINTFEPQPSGNVVLAGHWRVTNGAGKLVAQHDALIREPLHEHRPNADRIGQAMSDAVRKLARRIVARAG